ncbi:hypothetical protein [Kitasatospora herbaricolor]|uniref:hypothetical protein n=1 Tax=Kitasatospora herbaricolor TaxID=68217 RepID=UPI0036DA44BA
MTVHSDEVPGQHRRGFVEVAVLHKLVRGAYQGYRVMFLSAVVGISGVLSGDRPACSGIASGLAAQYKP